MDVSAYFGRVGYTGSGRPTVATLRALHRAHVTTIPFENLDIQLGLPIALDAESLEDKLVRRRRGGYCFEHNTLSMHLLRALGYEVTACEARVRAGAKSISPRTHMVLLVGLDGATWLWDTGFGGDTLVEPLRMDGAVVEQGAALYRVRAEGSLLVLQMDMQSVWTDLYAFVPEAREPIDFEVGNWYTSTHPRSHFVTKLTAQIRTLDGARVLRNLTYTVRSGATIDTREIARDDLVPLLGREFGLALPPGSRFRGVDPEV